MLGFIALIISIFVLIKVYSVEKRLPKQKGPAVLEPPKEIETTQPTIAKDITPASFTIPDTEDPLEKILKWYTHEWPLKTGALLIVLGFVWLISYAFLNNWIGPSGRIALGFMIGSLILIGGELRMKVEKTQGTTLCWLGASILLVTVYGAQMIYHMFDPYVALGFVFIIMIAMTFISLKHNRYSLSLATLIIAGITPSIVGSGPGNLLLLYAYLLVITIGTVWVARFTGWRSLTIFTLVIVTFYSLSYMMRSYSYNISVLVPLELLQLRVSAVIFAGVFYIATLLPLLRQEKVERLDIITPFAVGVFSFLWINAIVPPHLQSVVTLLTAIIYAMGAYLVYARTEKKFAVYVYTGVATVLLAIATAYAFEGPVLIIAFSIQALLLAPLTIYALGVDNGKWLLAYFILPISVSIPELASSNWQNSIFHESFYSIFFTAATLIVSGVYFYYHKAYTKVKDIHDSSIALIIIGTLYLLYLIWNINQVVFDTDDTARMVSLFIYTIIGLTTYVMGEVQKRRILYLFGLILLIGVIARLLLYEVWNMELVGRIITFFAVGILLIGSVLLRRNRTT